MATTLPVPNLNSPLVNKLGKILPPWNSWFQQFSQAASAIVSISATSPYQANSNGTVVITGTVINLTRGSTTIALGNGQKIIPISIGDIVSWTTASAVQFLGA